MSYIESHQELEGHPKTLDLLALLGLDIDTALGRVHRFWWWCLTYAETGVLEKHPPSRIDAKFGAGFVAAMTSAGFIDRDRFRVHDWPDWAGRYLTARYRTKKPVYLAEIFLEYGRREDAARILASAVNAGTVTAAQRDQMLGAQDLPLGDSLGQSKDGPRSDLGQPNSSHLNSAELNPTQHDNGDAPTRGKPRASEPEPYRPQNESAVQALAAIGRCRRVRLKDVSVIEQWVVAFPDVDLAAEIAKCESWATASTVTRSERGWARTLNTWLAKEQDRTKGSAGRRAANPNKPRAQEGKYDHV